MTRYDTSKAGKPAAPIVSLEVDADWEARDVPDADLALVLRTATGHFAPNLTVFTDRRPDGFGPRDLLDALDHNPDRPDLVAEETFTTSIVGIPFAARVVSFTDPAAGTLAQLHLATAVKADADSEPGVGLVYIVGTVAGARVDQDLPLFKGVLDTLLISA